MDTIKKLSKEEVLHLAKLAGLTLTDKEIEKNSEQLSETISYIKNLEKLNTEGIIPTNSVVNLSNITFEDGTANRRGLSQSEAVANGKNIANNAFVVDKIM